VRAASAKPVEQGDPLANFNVLSESFRRTLLAENKSPQTVTTYLGALRALGDFLITRGMPTEPGHLPREHVEAFIADLLELYKPATASNRYRALKVFFKWCVEEAERRSCPMERMNPPHVPESPPDVLTTRSSR